jgi:hypothetical protein
MIWREESLQEKELLKNYECATTRGKHYYSRVDYEGSPTYLSGH